MTKKYLIAVFVLACSLRIIAQEVLLPLSYNPVAAKKYQHLQSLQNASKKDVNKTTAVGDTLDLPFIDDFSKPAVYPDTALWLDDHVFINATYPIAPVTIGVATFDGLGSNGLPRDFKMGAAQTGPSDTLTSKPLHMGSTTVDDSIYFSFFYQAKGRGNPPQQRDSFVLEFRQPSTQKWHYVWSKGGYNPTASDSGFHLVMVPFRDTTYLRDGFQFRFRNYATLSGNLDHWHIDYVYLNKNRSVGDTIFDDVSFVYPTPSLLKEYTAMPWSQFQPSDMKSQLHMFFRNNKSSSKNINYRDSVIDYNTRALLGHYDAQFFNIDPFVTNAYSTYAPFAYPPVNFTIPTPTDSVAYEVIHMAIPQVYDQIHENDTLRGYQEFYNYYSYDDGSAERGYGVNQVSAQVAYKFTLNKADTLRALEIFFTTLTRDVSELGTNSAPFKLTVWAADGAGGAPGTILYQADTVVYAIYEQGFNAFHVYPIKRNTFLIGSGSYYIGWQQVNAEFLGVGYDVNNNNNNKIYYNLSGLWEQSNVSPSGSLMIRPIFGKKYSLVGLKENEKSAEDISVFPNPAEDMVTVTCKHSQFTRIVLTDITGNEVIAVQPSQAVTRVDIAALSNGVYFIRMEDTGKQSVIRKLVIAR